jgi:hypothetical protein
VVPNYIETKHKRIREFGHEVRGSSISDVKGRQTDFASSVSSCCPCRDFRCLLAIGSLISPRWAPRGALGQMRMSLASGSELRIPCDN